MSEQPEKQIKKQQDESYIKCCDKCTKIFTNELAYNRHVHHKHEEGNKNNASGGEEEHEESQEDQDKEDSKNNSKKANKNVPVRSRMLEVQRNELQDNIYTFLGQLGEKNVEPISSRAEIINFANDQKLTGQTNYSVNKVIRTPYEQPIKCSQEIPNSELEKSKRKDFLAKLKKQLQILEARVEAEKQVWELRDPMAPEEEVADEFSLMDIKKLIQNYPKRKINLDFPHFSIFLLWIGRICKSPAFKEFFMVLGEYIGEYEEKQISKAKGQKAYDNWREYFKEFEQKKIETETLQGLKIFDEKNCKKFIEYFVQWTDIFRALNI